MGLGSNSVVAAHAVGLRILRQLGVLVAAVVGNCAVVVVVAVIRRVAASRWSLHVAAAIGGDRIHDGFSRNGKGFSRNAKESNGAGVCGRHGMTGIVPVLAVA